MRVTERLGLQIGRANKRLPGSMTGRARRTYLGVIHRKDGKRSCCRVMAIATKRPGIGGNVTGNLTGRRSAIVAAATRLSRQRVGGGSCVRIPLDGKCKAPGRRVGRSVTNFAGQSGLFVSNRLGHRRNTQEGLAVVTIRTPTRNPGMVHLPKRKPTVNTNSLVMAALAWQRGRQVPNRLALSLDTIVAGGATIGNPGVIKAAHCRKRGLATVAKAAIFGCLQMSRRLRRRHNAFKTLAGVTRGTGRRGRRMVHPPDTE